MHRTIPTSLLLFGLLLAGCSTEQTLKEELEAANHCETAADCTLIGSTCPFDCYIYVHASEAERLKMKVDAYVSDCMYSCIQSFGVSCEKNRCIPVIEPPEDVPQIPSITTCTVHEDCSTPMEYLTRSSCPFTSRCVEGVCATVCPMTDHDMKDGAPMACAVDVDCTCNDYAGTDTDRCACVDGACMAVMKSEV